MTSLFLVLRVYLIFLAPLFLQTLAAQTNQTELFTIKGQVVDFRTGDPLPGANVYLNNTFLGAASDADGNFTIYNIPPGTYQLIATYVGYEVAQKPLYLTAELPGNIRFRLKQKIFKTGEVLITADFPKIWKQNLKLFTQEFIGKGDNGSYCTILNPEVLSFSGNWRFNSLEATASDILQVENRALGYKLYVILEEFVFHKGTIRYKVYPRFEYLAARNADETQRWSRNRAKTFIGSFTHFLRALSQNMLEEEGFKLYTTDNFPPEDYIEKAITGDEILHPGNNEFENELYFYNVIKVKFQWGEAGERTPLGNWKRDKTLPKRIADVGVRKPTTWIRIGKPPVYFDKFGYVLDQYRLKLYGDWVLSRVSDMLPRDYTPNYAIRTP